MENQEWLINLMHLKRVSLIKSNQYYENIKLHEMIYFSYIGRDKT